MAAAVLNARGRVPCGTPIGLGSCCVTRRGDDGLVCLAARGERPGSKRFQNPNGSGLSSSIEGFRGGLSLTGVASQELRCPLPSVPVGGSTGTVVRRGQGVGPTPGPEDADVCVHCEQCRSGAPGGNQRLTRYSNNALRGYAPTGLKNEYRAKCKEKPTCAHAYN
jgi:hypothetical protein